MPVRVGFWSPVLYRAGGTETWHATLLPRLAADPRLSLAGLAVLSPDECDPLTAGLIAPACPVTAGWQALVGVANASDVVVFWGIDHPETFLVGPNRRPRTVAVSHGDGNFPWGASTMLACSPWSDRYVGVSAAALDPVPEHRRADAVVIHNAVDPAKLTPKLGRDAQRRRWGVPARGCKVLGLMSRVSDEKDPKALARAVACLPPEWVGVAVGDGPDMGEAQAHAFGTAGTRVFWPGCTDDAASAYGAFDALLCPSTSEGFGLSAVEGLACGLPVVSTPVGVAREEPVASLVTTVPVGADGPTLAAAVLAAESHAVLPVRQAFSAERFAAQWADFLAGVASW